MLGIRVPGYLTETVITRFHFSVPITRKRHLKILTEHLTHTNEKSTIFVDNNFCVENGDAARGRKLLQ